MTYYGGKEIAAAFRTVRANTLAIAKDIPEDKYNFQAAPDTRTIGKLLVHIAIGPTFQLHVHGGKTTDMSTVNFPELFQKLGAEEAKPRNKAETIAFLESEGVKFTSFVEGLSDAFLAEVVRFPAGADPAAKTRFEMLLSPKEHEMHHRGQLMLLERLIGIVPHLTRAMQARMAQQAAKA